MNLYQKHVGAITDCFASVLMPNHFHLLVRLHEVDEIINSSYVGAGLPADLQGFLNLEGLTGAREKIELAEKKAYQHFSNMFNAYAKAINKRYKRHGSLFQSRFRRKLIKTDIQFQNTLVYIHNNPVKHGFTTKPEDYPYSSYHDYISLQKTDLHKFIIKTYFDDLNNFVFVHNKQDIDYSEFDNIFD